MKPLTGLRLTYFYLTLAHFKGRVQGHVLFIIIIIIIIVVVVVVVVVVVGYRPSRVCRPNRNSGLLEYHLIFFDAILHHSTL